MNRKELVKALRKYFNVQPRYMGAPSFSYEFETANGIYVIDQNGKVFNSEANLVDLDSLLNGSSADGGAISVKPVDPVDPDASPDSEALNEPVASNEPAAPAAPVHQVLQEGTADTEAPTDPVQSEASAEPEAPVAPAASSATGGSADPAAPAEPAAPSDQAELGKTDLEITVPLDGHTGLTLRNLVNLIYSRQALIAKALGYDWNIIEEPFIAAIHDRTVDTSEKLMEKIAEVANLCPGIGFFFESRKLTFKFFQDETTAEKVQAYTQFVHLLSQTAKTLKYASSKSKDTDNDKFTFRLFLIRLGMVGEEYKTARKVLLDKLEGNSAFRNGSKPEKTVAESTESVESAEVAEGVS